MRSVGDRDATKTRRRYASELRAVMIVVGVGGGFDADPACPVTSCGRVYGKDLVSLGQRLCLRVHADVRACIRVTVR